MSATMKLSNYGYIISDKSVGDQILKEVESLLLKNHVVTIDFDNIKSMATFCAKQIFGFLYLKLKSEQFYERLSFKNVNDDVKLLIRIGIQNALEEEETGLSD